MISKLKSPTSCWRNLQGRLADMSSTKRYLHDDISEPIFQEEFINGERRLCHYVERKCKS